MVTRAVLLGVAGMCLSASSALAQVYNVPGDFATIQAAINAAQTGATIIVAPGTYNGALNFENRDITLRSSGGPGVTTLNGGPSQHTIRIDDRNSRALVVEGFTITNGGVAVVGANCSPTIRNCVITGNSTADQAIYIEQSSPLFENCTIANNAASSGAGARIVGFPRPDALFVNCTFSNNFAIFPGDPRGGAIYLESGRATFEGCTFSDNTADAAGGAIHIRSDESRLIVRNSFFTNNMAQVGGAIEDISNGNSSILIEGCTFTGNRAAGGEGGGAARLQNVNASRVFRGTTFDANTAWNGVAVDIDRGPVAGTLFEDCVFTNQSPFPVNATVGEWGALRIRNDARVTIIGTDFVNNRARGNGGAVSVWDTAVVDISDCSFVGNVAPNTGGAINQTSSSLVTITNSEFRNNSATEAGAIRSEVSPLGGLFLIGCAFEGNNARGLGTLDFRGGNYSITGCTFSENWANDGISALHVIDTQSFAMKNSVVTDNFHSCGGGSVYVRNVAQPAIIENCTIAHNVANCASTAGLVLDTPLNMSVRNSIIWGNGNAWETPPIAQITGGATPSVQHSIVQYGYTGTGNTSTDPLFANVASGDFRPREGSPAIDTGSNAAVTTLLDINGATRILDGDANGVATVDRGAYEAVDCNTNAVPDFRDIASGAASDLNLNGTPDSCDDNFTVNLRTGTTYASISAAVAASQSGDELRATSLQFATPSFVTFQNRLITISSFDSIVQGVGATLELTNGAWLATAPTKALTVRGTLRTSSGAGADVSAGSFGTQAGSLLLARSNSSMSIGASSASVAGQMRLDPNAVMTFGGALTHSGSATLLAGSNLICDSTLNATSTSSLIATAATVVAGPATFAGTAQFSDSYIIAPSVLVPSSGDFTAYGEIYGDFVNSGESTFSRESRIFGDYTNNVGGTTAIRSGTLFLFGSLTNNGTIIGTLCTNCLSTPPNMDIGGSLNLGPAADLNMAFLGSYVRAGGNFDCAINDNDRYDMSLASLRMARSSGSAAEQTLEVMSTDIGPDVLGLDRTIDGHFPIGTLEIGAGSTVRLVDNHDNDGLGQGACEAIYVDQLIVGAGANLINTSCKIYYNTLEVQGTVAVPENLVPLGSGCAACAADYDNNGGVDGGDLGAFFNDFEQGLGCADVDQNGGVDGGDLAFFFSVFEAGGC